MIRRLIAVLFLVVAVIASAAAAQAERRLALVIGIDDYQSIPKLKKAVGDAEAMAEKLQSLGFEVTKVINAKRQTLNIEISRFKSRLSKDDLAFIHFSGHGVEIDGDNYLLPSDIPKPQSGQKDAIKFEGIRLSRLIAQVSETEARARLFVLDACRDNPFQQIGTRAVGTTRGLARIEASTGTFIMYSAGYKQKALDQLGPADNTKTSVYTRVLLSKLDAPGKSIAQIAREVRSDVSKLAKRIGHPQRPAYYDELSSSLILKAAVAKPEPQITETPVKSDANNQLIELAYWNAIEDSKDKSLFQSYLDRYPNGSFSPIAVAKIRSLHKAKESAAIPSETRVVSTSNTENSIEEISPSANPDNERVLVSSIQQQLNRLGCSAGRVDGNWGRISRSALGKFARNANVKLVSLDPSQEVLNELESHSVRVCPLTCGSRYKVQKNKCVLKQCGKNQTLTSRGKCVAKIAPKPKKKKKTKTSQSVPHKKQGHQQVCASCGGGNNRRWRKCRPTLAALNKICIGTLWSIRYH